MTLTRLPPSTLRIDGCSNCPMYATVVDDAGDILSDKCQHPEIAERDVTGEEGVPDFCPLLRAPLRIELATPGIPEAKA